MGWEEFGDERRWEGWRRGREGSEAESKGDEPEDGNYVV